MSIRVEFYGIARQRAGRASISIAASPGSSSMRDVLNKVAMEVPGLSELIAGGQLHWSLAANLDGNRFISDPDTVLCDDQSLLLLSADAGG